MKDQCTRKRLYCLNVIPVYKDKSDPTFNELYPLPQMALCDFGKAILNQVSQLETVLQSHELSEVSKQTHEVTWYFNKTNRFHIAIPTYLHVTSNSVYFSGCLPPYKQTYFKTVEIPIAELTGNSRRFKEVDLARLQTTKAQSLIRRIERENVALDDVSMRIDGLQKLADALAELDETSCELESANAADQIAIVQSEISRLDYQLEVHESNIKSLSLRLLNRVFDIALGGWLFHLSEGKTSRLSVERVSLYDNKLYIIGTRITQKLEVGKVQDSITIDLVATDEH